MKHAIKNLSQAELAAWLRERGQPGYRQAQIRECLYRRQMTTFAAMTTLPAALRMALDEEFTACAVAPLEMRQADDGTVKFLFGLSDGEAIESVFIPALGRRTVCVSSQVGCPVGCAFCASGRGGFARNLSCAEMVDQVVFAGQYAGATMTNVVVMGMGEPMLNLTALIAALDLLCSPDHLALSARHLTISTSGIPAGIRTLADHRRPWNLAISLHATSDEERATLIPPNYRATIADILAAGRYYRQQTGRMVTLEYALIAGRNDGDEDADRLAAIARDLRAKVNLIPCNQTSGQHRAPATGAVEQFHRRLLRQGVQASIRQRRGEPIQAACGQLRAKRRTGDAADR